MVLSGLDARHTLHGHRRRTGRRDFAIPTVVGQHCAGGHRGRPDPQTDRVGSRIASTPQTGPVVTKAPPVLWTNHLILVDMAAGSQVGS